MYQNLVLTLKAKVMAKTVKALTQIKEAQQKWANELKIKKGINLVSGTFNEDGIDSNKDKNYFEKIEYNIFGGELNNKDAYSAGDGNEIKAITHRPKMSALHSSSALVVNLFQYWQGKDTSPLLEALIKNNDKTINTKIKFEGKFEIDKNKKKFPKPANLDVTIELLEKNKIIAIESKFTEPYGSVNVKISKSYLEESLWKWNKYSDLKNLTEKIYNKKSNFQYLDAAQLIKHILGLKNSKYKENFTLLYLWYDVPGTEESKEHQKEIEAFASIAKADGIDFRHITYQKVIDNLNKLCPEECHQDYINYLKRYNQQ